jgi:hypothetical protein
MTPRTAQLEPLASAARWPWLQSAAEMAALYAGAWSDPALPMAACPPQAPRVATRSPAPTVSSLAAARSFTLTTVQRWGAGDWADDVAAVVSELLANALRHALPRAEGTNAGARSRPIRLGLLDMGPCVLCAVADPSAQAPVHREPDWLEESGRGLQVVASLSSHWGFCMAPDLQGKVVWATIGTTAVQRLSRPAASTWTPAHARRRSATPAGAADPSGDPAPRSRLRRWPPRRPSARGSECRTGSCAGAAAGRSARPARPAG